MPLVHPLPIDAPAPVARGTLRWWAGVDGGGSRTRLRLQDGLGRTLGVGEAGPSALSQGAAQAWHHVLQALTAAAAAAGAEAPPPAEVALGLGLAGAGVAAWRSAFLAADPGFAVTVLASDAETQLLGAHAGQPGIVVAAGTGSVAAARLADGRLQLSGGWGFPIGDEGSGAWLGLQAVRHAQQVLDGRAAASGLSAAVLSALGADAPALQAWSTGAGAHRCAQAAPLVFGAAAAGCTLAAALLQQAADDLAAHVPAAQGGDGRLPVVLCGSVGQALRPRWPATLRGRLVEAQGDSADGALRLLREHLHCAPPA